MKTSATKEKKPKGLISVGVVLAAIAISLTMQGAAQAWWGLSMYLIWRGGW
jgi:hypothetical protein